MLKILRSSVDYSSKSYSSLSINVSDTEIKLVFRMKPEKDEESIDKEVIVTLDDFRNTQNMSDGSLYLIDRDRNSFHHFPPINYTAISKSSRSRYRSRDSMSRGSYFAVFFPYAEATFSDCTILIVEGTDTAVNSNIEFTEEPLEYPIVSYANMPNLLLPIDIYMGNDTVEVSSYVDMTITVRDHNGHIWEYPMDIYLESDKGYLPYRKIKVIGQKTVPLYALGLKSGDIIRVKVGYRWYVNTVYKDIRVV